MSFLVTTKNYFETLIMEDHLTEAKIEYTRTSNDTIEVHSRFLTTELAYIFVQCAEKVIKEKQTMDGTKLTPLLLN